jgi:predicted membrane protein
VLICVINSKKYWATNINNWNLQFHDKIKKRNLYYLKQTRIITRLEDIMTQPILFLKIILVLFSYFNYRVCDNVTCHFNNVMYSLCNMIKFLFMRRVTIINTHYVPWRMVVGSSFKKSSLSFNKETRRQQGFRPLHEKETWLEEKNIKRKVHY